ncbi:hypothetical protein D3C80_1647060 [compost metagenome]
MQAMRAVRVRQYQVVGGARCFAGQLQHLSSLLPPFALEHLRQAPDQHIEKTADHQPEQAGGGGKGCGVIGE